MLEDITVDEITSIPIWECWTEEKKEFIKPSDKKEVFDGLPESHIVLTYFKLKNKTKFTGFCSPQDPSGMDYIQPTIITKEGQINFFQKNEFSLYEKSSLLKKLQFKVEEVFPIEYTTQIKSNGSFHKAMIFDFNDEKLLE